MSGSFGGTTAWLRGQWTNPGDVFTILMIIGGEIVQVAIAQLCCGPIPSFTPVSFSFGWVRRVLHHYSRLDGEAFRTADD